MKKYFVTVDCNRNNTLLVVKELMMTAKEYREAFSKPYKTFKEAFDYAKARNKEQVGLWRVNSGEQWVDVFIAEANSITPNVANF